MPIIPQPPADVTNTKIFDLLLKKSTSSDGTAERARQFVETATPLVDLVIGGPFKEYTLHNRDHAKKLLHLAEYIIPSSVLTQLSVLEYLLIIYSAYLHDMGMCLTSTERDRIVGSDEFTDVLRGWPEIWDALVNARQRLAMANNAEMQTLETEVYQLHEAALCAYLRPRHATSERYKSLIELLRKQSNRSDLFELHGVSFEDILIDICISHNLDVGALAEVNGTYDERFPRSMVIGGERVNTQFCAAVLRLVDILDFDRERTPNILFESLGIASRSLPGADVSLREWKKHMAVHAIEIAEHEIVVSAECHHPVIEKAIRDFCQTIEREIRDTLAVIRRNPPIIHDQYVIELPVSVRPSIRSMGYVFKDVSLRINQSAIMSLLMGDRLYSHPAVAIRELLQNSIDACSARQLVEGTTNYDVLISLRVTTDDSGRRWLEVKDNGIGMDEFVLSEFFLKLGDSYYESPEFQRLIRWAQGGSRFMPIARFGIGIVSTFMLADVLEVQTRRAHSPRGDMRGRLVRIERMGGLAFVSELAMSETGTSVRIRLRPEFCEEFEEFVGQISSYLQEIVVRPKFDIQVELLDKRFVLTCRNVMSLKTSAKKLLSKRKVEVFEFDLSRWSDRISGSAILLFSKTADNKLSYLWDEEALVVQRLGFGGAGGIDPRLIIDEYRGNRITVNGFRMSMKKMESVLGLGKRRIGIAYDLDVIGGEDIIYDVSRDRIVGNGKVKVVNAIRASLKKGLFETGVMDRFTDKTKLLFSYLFDGPVFVQYTGDFLEAIDKELLQRVADLLPRDDWPVGLHKTVAAELGIAPKLASKAIGRLLRTGVVRNPNPVRTLT